LACSATSALATSTAWALTMFCLAFSKLALAAFSRVVDFLTAALALTTAFLVLAALTFLRAAVTALDCFASSFWALFNADFALVVADTLRRLTDFTEVFRALARAEVLADALTVFLFAFAVDISALLNRSL